MTVLALAAALVASSARPPAAPLRAEGAGSAPDGSIRFVQSGVEIDLRLLDGDARLEFLRAHAGLATDLFAVEREGRPLFRVFLLRVDNRGGGAEVVVATSGIRLRSADVLHAPHGYVMLYDHLRVAVSDEGALRGLQDLLSDTAFTVPPGSATERLLVFERVADKKRVELVLGSVFIGTEAWPITARFRKP